jgi:hypothetical protein
MFTCTNNPDTFQSHMFYLHWFKTNIQFHSWTKSIVWNSGDIKNEKERAQVPQCKHPDCYVSCCELMQEWLCCTGNSLWQAPRLCHVLQRISHLPSPLCWFASLWQAKRESPSVWPKQECVVYAVRENVNDITFYLQF